MKKMFRYFYYNISNYYMDYKAIWMYYRAVIVSIMASMVDMGSMYGLNSSTNLSEPLIIGLSSFLGLLIQFLDKNIGLLKIQHKTIKN